MTCMTPPSIRCAILHQKFYHVGHRRAFSIDAKPMTSTIIVGAGVIGLFTARELVKAGHTVTLIDRQQSGQESSWAGGGIISPLFPWRYPAAITRLAKLSQGLYEPALTEMTAVTGYDPEYLQSGMLAIGDYSTEQPETWQKAFDVDMQKVSGKDLRALAPEVSGNFDQGWWLPGIHQVRNPRLVALLKSWLATTDACLLEHEPVESISVKNGRANGVYTSQQHYKADNVVVASGAWTSRVLSHLNYDPGIRPIKGQMLLLKGPVQTVRHITLADDRYIIPRKDGRVLVGSTTEHCGFEKKATESVKEQLLEFGGMIVPALKTFQLEHHWAGLRPGSSNELPVIGQHPSIENLYINAGHYRNGLVLAPASGRLLSEIINHQTTSIPVDDYLPTQR